jgi:phage terminase small subunit
MSQKRPASKRGRPRTSKRTAFLAAYVKCGNPTLAARRAQVSRQQHYEWLKDSKYSAAFARAHKEMEELYLEEIVFAKDPKQKGKVETAAATETWAAEKAPRGSNRIAFLAAYVQCGNVTLAARRAQVSRQQHYEWLKDPTYSREFAKIQRELFDG